MNEQQLMKLDGEGTYCLNNLLSQFLVYCKLINPVKKLAMSNFEGYFCKKNGFFIFFTPPLIFTELQANNTSTRVTRKTVIRLKLCTPRDILLA